MQSLYKSFAEIMQVSDTSGTNGAISQQNGNAIHDGIAPPAALAPYGLGLKLQRLAADGTDDPEQILCRQ
jgi:hypothetical protein